MHMGFMMRQQAISAIHAKVLRLNSASIAAVSVGQVCTIPALSLPSAMAQAHKNVPWSRDFMPCCQQECLCCSRSMNCCHVSAHLSKENSLTTARGTNCLWECLHLSWLHAKSMPIILHQACQLMWLEHSWLLKHFHEGTVSTKICDVCAGGESSQQ